MINPECNENSAAFLVYHKEPVASASDLPSSGNHVGDVYLVESDSKYYMWDGDSWEVFSNPYGGGGSGLPYAFLEHNAPYLYTVEFNTIPPDNGVPSALGSCSTYVSGGKVYRNLDWGYTNLASFLVKTREFTGMAFLPGLEEGSISNNLVGQLPYHVVDGINAHGIMVTEHVLYNDWDWVGTGNTPLYRLPYTILNTVKSMDTIADDLADVLSDLYATPTLTESDYLLQFIVTDGTTTYAVMPPTSASGAYVLEDITVNPKLANFRWVEDETVTRAELQDRPTGVERWNLMPCALSDLKFTDAYTAPTRLSEFIGINGTTKDSTDEELEAIYDLAHAEYLVRQRDGETWQTMHSVVYAPTGMEHLYIQEDWTRDFVGSSGGGGTSDYESLDNLPKINNATLIGNKSASDLGLVTEEDIAPFIAAMTPTDETTFTLDCDIEDIFEAYESARKCYLIVVYMNTLLSPSVVSKTGDAVTAMVFDGMYGGQLVTATVTEGNLSWEMMTLADTDTVQSMIDTATSPKLDASSISHESWTFTLDDDTTVTKEVVTWIGQA